MSDDAYPSLDLNDASPTRHDDFDEEPSSQDDAEMQDEDDQTISENEAESNTTGWRPNEAAKSTRYPNLQVTQSIIHPKKLRRQDSAVVDCFHVLSKVFGKADYKGKQKEIMQAAVRGADVLVVAPTGMGKSLCFQVPAVADKFGVTLVVSPLLALMKDQVSKLKLLKIPVYAFTSETSAEEREEIIKDLSSGHPRCRLLYVTPEKLCSAEMNNLLRKIDKHNELNRLVIDEAHCISEWGTDFRQEYRRLGTFRDRFPEVPIMALTATATPMVQDDIMASLKMCKDHLFKVVHPFNRENLLYEVQYLSPSEDNLTAVSNYILRLYERRGKPSTGIVYCRSRDLCNTMSAHLRSRGINSKPYHRGLPMKTLEQTLKQWEEDSEESTVDVVCATVAFGLGIDKGDVRYVIHADIPKSFEGYYQETGRAGRDGLPAKVILFYSREDAVRVQHLVRSSQNKPKMMNGATTGASAKDLSRQAEASLAALIKFAESTTVCRHISICRFFGEKIDASDPVVAKAYCDKFCDICKDPEKTKERKKALSSEEYVGTQVPRLQREAGSGDEADETPLEPPPRIQLPGFRKASDLSRISSSRPAVAPAQPGLDRVDLADENEAEAIEPPTTNKPIYNAQPNKSKQFNFKAPTLVGGQKPLRIGLGHSSRSTCSKTNDNQVKGAFKPVAFKVPELPKRSPVPDSSDPPNDSSDPSDPNSRKGPSDSSDPPEQNIVDIESSEDDSDNPNIVNEIISRETTKSTSNITSAKVISAPQRADESWGEGVLSEPTISKRNLLGTKARDVFYPAAPRKEKMQEDPASDGEVGDLSDAVKRSRELTEARAQARRRSVSPDDSDDLEVECPFSTKIPLTLRTECKQRLRKAIWTGLLHGVGEDGRGFMWQRLNLPEVEMLEATRLCSNAAKEVEFYVFGLSVTTAGYEMRIDERLRGIREAFGPDARAKVAWLDDKLEGEIMEDEDLELACEFVGLLRVVAGRLRVRRTDR